MKPSLPQGTRDFGPEIIRKRQFIIQNIQSQFELFGFQPIETPAFENLETLVGKYGEEGDKLMFKILNNGLEKIEKHEQANLDFAKILEGKSVKGLTERALKYDLTIPFARYIAMNHNVINMPFKRYQIQNVWRADRPQKGRYREFTQCDADIVGSESIWNEIELIGIYSTVFNALNIPVSICINNRKILAALAELCGGVDLLTSITIAIDKLDKIGLDKVIIELQNRGLLETAIEQIKKYLQIAQSDISNNETLAQLKIMFDCIEIGQQGIAELLYITNQTPNIKIDVTLARGLNYYTGSIFEVKPLGVQMGSIGGGGRYNDLTSLFGVNHIAGVGISFGLDRIYDVMEELNLFPNTIDNSLKVMLINFGEAFEQTNKQVLQYLRAKGIACELFPDAIKFDKQLKYANKRNVEFIGMIGEDELTAQKISIKNFKTGVQTTMDINQIELV
jgi:histidyl-tRNA synthetase